MTFLAKAVLITTCLVAATMSSYAIDIECPRTISETPSLRDVPDDWEGVVQTGQRPLEQIGLYLGHPQKKGSLVPDDETKTRKEESVTWKIVRAPQDEYWVGCTYYGTSVILARKLDEHVSRCVARYSMLPSHQRDSLIGFHCD